MRNILIINTGGTFNKVYNPLNGNLDIDLNGNAVKQIAKNWLVNFKVINIIGKDSLDIDEKDREILLKTIKKSSEQSIIIIHGTDTMDKSAKFLDEAHLEKVIILTGAMVPYSIDPIEATANFSSAYGYINAINKSGVYIAMNGVIKDYTSVIKNKEKGYFE